MVVTDMGGPVCADFSVPKKSLHRRLSLQCLNCHLLAACFGNWSAFFQCRSSCLGHVYCFWLFLP